MELTTWNMFKPDSERFTRLRLKHSAALGKQISQPEYLAGVADIQEHLDNCPDCMKMVQGHIRRR